KRRRRSASTGRGNPARRDGRGAPAAQHVMVDLDEPRCARLEGVGLRRRVGALARGRELAGMLDVVIDAGGEVGRIAAREAELRTEGEPGGGALRAVG